MTFKMFLVTCKVISSSQVATWTEPPPSTQPQVKPSTCQENSDDIQEFSQPEEDYFSISDDEGSQNQVSDNSSDVQNREGYSRDPKQVLRSSFWRVDSMYFSTSEVLRY